MASDTSSELNTNLLDKENQRTGLKKETTETDLYLGLVSNPSKTMVESAKSTSSLHYNNDSDASVSSDNNVSSDIKQSERKSSKIASKKASKIPSRKASRKSENNNHSRKSYINSS